MTVTSDAPLRGPDGVELGDAAGRGSWGRRVFLLAMGIAIVAGVSLRLHSMSELWLDEALSVNIARLPLGELPGALKVDGAPPLYYVLLHGWTAVFGTSNVAVRSLSGVFAIATLPVAWYAGRRIGGPRVAWAAALVLAANPYAIRYATETRMYALEIFLVFAGILAFRRAFEAPTTGRLAVLALVVSALLWNQYWAFYLVAVVFALLFWVAWRSADPARAAARRMLVAFVVGAATFLPWVPTFLYQSAHTGTPWGEPVLPGAPIGKTLMDFAGSTNHEGWLLSMVMLGLLLLGVFGRGVDDRRIELDLRTQPQVRYEAIVGGATLVLGASLTYLAGSAFQTRYSAIMFPFWVLVVARGLGCLTDSRVRAAVVVGIVGLGLLGGGRNLVEDRTQAGDVAAVLEAEARPGDLVLYCPDQLGPAVQRLTPPGLDEVTYPFFERPGRIDWVDYKERLATVEPAEVARRALERAGPDHAIWVVSGPGYTTHSGLCETMSAELSQKRFPVGKVVPDLQVFEKPGLTLFAAP